MLNRIIGQVSIDPSKGIGKYKAFLGLGVNMGAYVPRMLLEELSVNNDLLQDTSSLLAYITNFNFLSTRDCKELNLRGSFYCH